MIIRIMAYEARQCSFRDIRYDDYFKLVISVKRVTGFIKGLQPLENSTKEVSLHK
jgi:hypothetical protein